MASQTVYTVENAEDTAHIADGTAYILTDAQGSVVSGPPSFLNTINHYYHQDPREDRNQFNPDEPRLSRRYVSRRPPTSRSPESELESKPNAQGRWPQVRQLINSTSAANTLATLALVATLSFGAGAWVVAIYQSRLAKASFDLSIWETCQTTESSVIKASETCQKFLQKGLDDVRNGLERRIIREASHSFSLGLLGKQNPPTPADFYVVSAAKLIISIGYMASIYNFFKKESAFAQTLGVNGAFVAFTVLVQTYGATFGPQSSTPIALFMAPFEFACILLTGGWGAALISISLYYEFKSPVFLKFLPNRMQQQHRQRSSLSFMLEMAAISFGLSFCGLGVLLYMAILAIIACQSVWAIFT
ncbi:hypothetical protein H072_9177 [Dactylellina haptotyla CBS 200.50]|uniref:Uncharacterized protein n=1 Tax=Dactylellina haptotyla (strain CBS 200.50) TaxID=1284197 RepID=S8A7T2_DACHA|nr:hypothetical protein H072_9177 [Dactylellina haptotyla CBS 200.50]